MISFDAKAEALIFDMDGTLIDSIPVHFKAWEAVIKRFGHTIYADYFLSLTGQPPISVSQNIIDYFKLDITPKELYQLKEIQLHTQPFSIGIIESVVEVVKHYHHKLPMAVGTGSSRKAAHASLQEAGLLHYFDAIVCSDDVTQFKPHPETFLKCAELLKVEPSKCVVFEDGQLGMQAAISAGMMVIDVKKYY